MNNLDKAAVGFLVLMVFSIYYSLFLLSISSIGFSAIALYKYLKERPKISWKEFSPYAALILLFILTVVSGINSEDIGHWARHLRLKVPFLFIPPAFFIQRKLVSQVIDKIGFAFFAVAIISSFQILYQLFDMESVMQTIKTGQAFDTPVDHIKYSIFIAFSIILAVIFYTEKRLPNLKWINYTLLIGAIYLFVILHLMAVRSGLAVFYISMFFMLFHYLIRYRKPIFAVGIVLLLLTPFAAFKTIPTLDKKIHYMIYDYQMFQKGEGSNLSDSERLYSYRAGLEIFKASPILGSGIGDLKKECKELYEEWFGESIDKYPHNQFLFILAGSGILGLLFFLIGMCYPIFYFRKKQDSEFFAIWLIIVVSFLVENTLERSYGISFFLLFLLGAMCKMSENYSKEEMVSNPQSR